MSSRKIPKKLLAPLLLLVLFLGIGAGWISQNVLSEDARFQRYTRQFFSQEISGNTLNLHYTLAHPEDYGIAPASVTLGGVYEKDPAASRQTLAQYIRKLSAFSPEKLSREHQITRDMLLLYFKTEHSLGENYLLEEVLSPSLGIQAQLPVLLAEYTFYDEQDILDYLQLLTCVDDYFQSVLTFEKKKSDAGYFMSDATLDRVVEQCETFLAAREDSYLEAIFEEKLTDFPGLSKENRAKYQQAHQRILKEHFFPAYDALLQGLKALRGTGKNENGLCYFDHGREFYQYLLHSQCGVYTTVEKVWKQLYTQLIQDSAAITQLLSQSSGLLDTYAEDIPAFSPADAVKDLSTRCQQDFPALQSASYQVKYVHESLEKFSSPAFYLTPPIDTNSPNTIYINKSSQTTNLDLFTTLAHEGFPGHLYQTLSFSRQNPESIRHLLSFGGYIEGWATYAESYAGQYAGIDEDAATLLWLNRSINLCIYSLLDVGIHYYGWTQTDAAGFLNAFGIRDVAVIEEIFQYILETPGNYLKYYVGCLNFLDLKERYQKQTGDDFDLVDFHQKVLAIGPVQFPVLKKYLLKNPS